MTCYKVDTHALLLLLLLLLLTTRNAHVPIRWRPRHRGTLAGSRRCSRHGVGRGVNQKRTEQRSRALPGLCGERTEHRGPCPARSMRGERGEVVYSVPYPKLGLTQKDTAPPCVRTSDTMPFLMGSLCPLNLIAPSTASTCIAAAAAAAAAATTAT